jgi:CHAT domain-containing protein/Tfp pilus assembly protein PilF
MLAQIPTGGPAPVPASSLGVGIVVEQVFSNAAAATAGLQPGDLLLTWCRGEACDEFSSPFDLPYIFFEQSPRGMITLSGQRGQQHRTWRIGSDTWGLTVRPNFERRLLSLYQHGQKSLAAEHWEEAVKIFQDAAAVSEPLRSPWLAGWLLSHAGKALSTAQQWNLADAAYRQAIELAPDAGPRARAELFRLWADAFDRRDDLRSAEHWYRNALLEYQKKGAGTLAVGNAFGMLAVAELKRGEFDIAEQHLLQAAKIEKELAPSSLQTMTIIANLAVMYQGRGQFQEAEKYYLEAKDLDEKYFPRSKYLARTLEDLGVLFDQEGDLSRSEAYERKALSIANRLGPQSPYVADVLASLADCLLEQNETLQAERYEKRALAIREKSARHGLSVAYSLSTLGRIARIRRNLALAQDYYRRALAIAVKVDAPNLDRSHFLIGLASVLRDRQDFVAAEKIYRQAAAILEREDPGSIDRADTLADLAGTVARQNRLDEAEQLYRQALSEFENQTSHLGYVENTRSRYRSEHLRYYQDFIDLLLAQGHIQQAFEVTEAARARTLLDMLARARVELDQDANPIIRRRHRELQGLLTAESEFRVRILSQPHSPEQLQDIDAKIQDLLLRLQEVEAQLRATHPAYTAMTEARPLSAVEIQKLLDPNTLLLEYSLGDDNSYVWAVTSTSLHAYPLSKRSEIEAAAHNVYRLLTARNRHIKPVDLNRSEAEYRAASNRLARILLQPVTHLLGERRLIIVADGVLEYIPFSALPEPVGGKANLPLVLKHEVVNLPSGSVLAELRRQRINRPSAQYGAAVLADPVFDPNDDRLKEEKRKRSPLSLKYSLGDTQLTRSAFDLGLTRDGKFYLSRLLYTRKEANAVIAATISGKNIAALDFNASRAFAMSGALARYRIIHFATHGILNNKHPELSGLVLSLVDKNGKSQRGFLKLQDVYTLKLTADLVVLSGCETGLGEHINGEGIVGLTRAFMYAGANRVVASLWSVSDMATASFMADFYDAMERKGMPPAAALRRAQIEMWREKRWHSPYFWAAFQLQGE